LNKEQSAAFWNALKAAPYEVNAGKVVKKPELSIQGLLDSARLSAKVFHELKPLKNQNEFEQYRLMADIRVQYLAFLDIERQVNEVSFKVSQIPLVLKQLEDLMAKNERLSRRFAALNKGYYHPSEIEAENQLRKARIQLLYDRLSRRK
jgi:hexosaminidase